MELTILGSGTSVPSLTRGSAGYLVRHGKSLLLLDSGPGTLQRVLWSGASLEEITHVLYSHTHVDHTADLAPLLFTSRNPSSPRRAPLTIGGSREFLEFFEEISVLYGTWIEATTYERAVIELDGRRREMGDLAVTARRVPHIASSIALRIEDPAGRTMVYSGDTGESGDLAELAAGVDLLLIEASFPDGREVKGHLTPASAGRIASKARPGKVVLTHFYPPCDAVDMLSQLRAAWPGEAALAEDGMRIRI
jgi:ribonuclease BN (tRNA processing enzyme)